MKKKDKIETLILLPEELPEANLLEYMATSDIFSIERGLITYDLKLLSISADPKQRGTLILKGLAKDGDEGLFVFVGEFAAGNVGQIILLLEPVKVKIDGTEYLTNFSSP